MLLLALACAPVIPAALEVDPVETAETPEPTDPTARLAWMIGEDPLARRPRVPSGDLDPPLSAWRDVATAPSAKAYDWGALEAAHRGSVAVPLARGARLAALETSLGDASAAFAWTLPLPAQPPTQEQVRAPLDWLGATTPDALLGIVERQVLLGWLDGPTIPVDAAAHALASPTYDRVATTPAGRILAARAAHAVDPAARSAGTAALEEATWLAAMGAAADRDSEQAAFRALRAEAVTRNGVTGDPARALLTRAADTLVGDAGTDSSAGGALLAQAALRWEGGCPDTPCGGFDRVGAMGAAARFGPELAGPTAAWQAIALKEALDHLQAAYDEPSFPHALDDIVEVLVGLGAPLDRGVLLYQRPGPPVQLALSRAAGGGDLTSRDDLLRTLQNRLATLARAAATSAPDRLREPLERMARRAAG
jgi:hypothetical protein